MKYVAMLRGINVGKLVRISMKDLKEVFQSVGSTNVSTYLNSGNVVFESQLEASELQDTIQERLRLLCGQPVPVLVKTAEEMISISESIPSEWGSGEGEQTYVAYLFKDVARPTIIDELPVKREYMNLLYRKECIMWNIKRENFNRSQINRIAEHSSYSRMTIRNITTAIKLAELSR
ncbi:MAG: DUF1697 domain-containing protein [Anaerolineae bacterium]|nr:DUF1697 domain-containing protein [Anaerolineae bacterium]